MDSPNLPELPETVTIGGPSAPELPELVPISGPEPSELPISSALPKIKFLKPGCYFAQWRPLYPSNQWFRYNGVMRIERHEDGVTASGDLYYHPARVYKGGKWVSNPDPSKRFIPIFARHYYRWYLRVFQVLEWGTTGSGFRLGFQRWWLNDDDSTWKYQGYFTAWMTFMTAPADYRKGATYMEGTIRDSSNTIVGTLSLGWASKYLRRAIVEVDRVPVSEHPADNGMGLNWRDVFDEVDWSVTAYQSSTAVPEPSGSSWNRAEMHAAMLDWRWSGANLDREWRYYLLCVQKIDGGSLGVMFDWRAADSNNVPREGACLSSHYVFPNNPSEFGSMAGQRYGITPAYFRTAVHEVGHAMGLLHYTADSSFMCQTGVIIDRPGKFLETVEWSFSAPDERRLRHLPDPWVRPGMVPFAAGGFIPISPSDQINLSESLRLEIKPLLSSVPIGAPVRVRITLRNMTDALFEVPASLSLMSGNVSGHVVGPSGSNRGFSTILRCIGEQKYQKYQKLEADAEISHDLTLLRGGDGALFEAPGLHRIKVDVSWEADDTPVCVRGSGSVIVQPAVTDSHAEAALKTLSTPDLLLTLALGGDHLAAGVEALQAALADETLKPHYAAIEAKRIGRRFRLRDANPSAAVKLLSNDTVMSPSEVKSMVSLLGRVAKHATQALKTSAAGDKAAEEMVNKL